MKAINLISAYSILLAGIALTGVSACKKYDEGPALSTHSKAERVANTWIVDNYKVNGNDYTSLVADYIETFTKDGKYSYSWGNFSAVGSWEFHNKDEEVWITGAGNQSPRILYIVKLEEDQFWYYYLEGNDRKEFHMSPK